MRITLSGPTNLVAYGYEIVGEFIYFNGKHGGLWFQYDACNQPSNEFADRLANGMWDFAGIEGRTL